MTWLACLRLLLSLADQLASFMHDKQLMDAGASQEALKNIRGAQDAIVRAKAARDAVRNDAASIVSDPDDRDNDGKPSVH